MIGLQEMFDVSSPVEDDSDCKPLLPENLTPRTKRKFDSVRNLLEKARAKLSRGRHNSTSSDEQLKHTNEKIGSEPDSPVLKPKNKVRGRLAVPEQQVSQSSPNTPLMARRLKSGRQSFSPVRY